MKHWESNMAESKPPSGLAILFADDETALQELMRSELPRMGHSVTVCPDGLTAIAALEKDTFDCLIVDLDMPGMYGIEVLKRAKELHPAIEAIVLTGKATKESAIEALRAGAFDYRTKPCRLADLASLLGRVAERRHLCRQLAALEHRLQRAEGDGQLIGEAPGMDDVRRLITKVGPTDSTVLIRGETGTGKELVARALHKHSLRASGPMVAINCGALPENLIESELFGHCRGAFTGADAARTGLFQVADSGTLFLDEIGELPLAMQAKLLRVLETGEIRRVGDDKTTKVDVRIVAATHRDLEAMVEEGEFREDLMFRINTFEITIPPLRERGSDLQLLACHLLRRFRKETRRDEELFSPETLEMLSSHAWPGNIRELANVIEHAAILCDGLPIQPEHLPRHFSQKRQRKTSPISSANPMSLKELELLAIHQSLQRHDGNKPAAADELGISLKTLYNKLNAEALERKTG